MSPARSNRNAGGGRGHWARRGRHLPARKSGFEGPHGLPDTPGAQARARSPRGASWAGTRLRGVGTACGERRCQRGPVHRRRSDSHSDETPSLAGPEEGQAGGSPCKCSSTGMTWGLEGTGSWRVRTPRPEGSSWTGPGTCGGHPLGRRMAPCPALCHISRHPQPLYTPSPWAGHAACLTPFFRPRPGHLPPKPS